MVGRSKPRKSCFKTNPLFCQITAVFIWGARQVIAALLLLLLLLLLCERLNFLDVSIFLRWVKISSEVKDGKKMFRHWVLWVKHLVIMMTYSQKVFFSRSISLHPGWWCASCPTPQDSGMCLSPFGFRSFLPQDTLDTVLVLHPKAALWGSHCDSYFRLFVEALKCRGFQAVWPFVGISAVPQVYLISLWLSASWLMRAASLPWLGCSVAKRELSSVKVASA